MFAKHPKLQNIFLISSNQRLNGPIRNGLAVIRERKRQLRHFPGTIHPYSIFRWYWDILMTMFLLAALALQPLQIAFYSTKDRQEISVVITSGAVACIFFLDIFFNSRTGILDPHSDTIILEKDIIFRNYAKSWFLIDIFSSIPFDAFYYLVLLVKTEAVGHDQYFYYKMIRLLGLLKVFRLFRVIQCLTRIQKAYKLPELRIRLINLLVMILTILHWLACWHWLVADLFNPIGHRKEFSWITRTKLWDKPVWFCYINAALRALSNMGCLGYGGFAGEAPAEAEDIVATIVSIMIGATCFALYIGTMGGIVQSVNASEKKYGDVILEVNEYLKFRNVPKELQSRVKSYYEQRYQRHFFDESTILNAVSDVLRNDLLMYNCKHLVEKVPLFKQLPQSFLQEIVAKLEFEVYLPGDLIIDADSEGQAMYFIQEGQVVILSNAGELISTLESGEFFGEMSLVTDDHKTTAKVIAQDYCDLYRLSRSDFHSVFDEHHEILSEIKSVARKRHEEIKCRRINACNKQTLLHLSVE